MMRPPVSPELRALLAGYVIGLITGAVLTLGAWLF
jgi:hypothetical protein